MTKSDNGREYMTFEFAEPGLCPGASMKVVGVGGAGCNAVNRMVEDGLSGVEFIAVNTDAQALMNSKADNRIQIGIELTRGLGAGGDPGRGCASAQESEAALRAALEGSDMVFVTCGEGGGTGTGAAPVAASIARELGALTVGVVTKPFRVEGGRRLKQAVKGIEELRKQVDTLIVIPNQRLLALVGQDMPFREALRMADAVLYKATKGIADLITIPGEINVDFADVRAVMLERGDALMGTGSGTGDERSTRAAQEAISSPLLEDVSIAGAQGVLVNITGGPDMTLTEVEEALRVVHDATGEDANIIFGTVVDELLENELRVTVIATGFDHDVEGVPSDPTFPTFGKRSYASTLPVDPRPVLVPAPAPAPAPAPVPAPVPVPALAPAVSEISEPSAARPLSGIPMSEVRAEAAESAARSEAKLGPGPVVTAKTFESEASLESPVESSPRVPDIPAPARKVDLKVFGRARTTVDAEDRSRPAYQRLGHRLADAPVDPPPSPQVGRDPEGENIEIPTYVRRLMD